MIANIGYIVDSVCFQFYKHFINKCAGFRPCVSQFASTSNFIMSYLVAHKKFVSVICVILYTHRRGGAPGKGEALALAFLFYFMRMYVYFSCIYA